FDHLPWSFGRWIVEIAALDARALLAYERRIDPDIAGGLLLKRLFPRAHDRLERGVARLVDRVADRDHGGQLHLDGVVAVLSLPLTAQRSIFHVQLDHLRQRRH